MISVSSSRTGDELLGASLMKRRHTASRQRLPSSSSWPAWSANRSK